MLILGSQSPRRKDLLSFLTKDFKILTADLDEEKFIPLARTPEELVVKIAKAKANKIIKVHKLENQIILTADTLVILNDDQLGSWQALGKPKDLAHAKLLLELLSDKTHQVYTGFCLINQKTNQIITDFSVSNVNFKKLSSEDIDDYVEKYKPLDKAGAYAAQEMGTKYIDSCDGDYFTIVGLDIAKVGKYLEDFDIKISKDWKQKASQKYHFK